MNCMSKAFHLKRDPKPVDSTDNLSLLGSSYDFCEVHRMVNEAENHKPYAVKLIDLNITRQYGVDDNDIFSESKLLRDLCHQNLVRHHCSFSSFDKKLSLVMDLVEGNDIGKYIRGKDKQAHITFYRWFIQMVTALDYLVTVAHMTHGDIQPRNIIINTDTGDATLVGICLPSLQKLLLPSTPPPDTYLSAERLAGETCTEQDDLWGLGLIFAELLLGMRREQPIWGSSEQAVALQTQLVDDCMEECTLLGSLLRHIITPTSSTRCSARDLQTLIEHSPPVHPRHTCSPPPPLMSMSSCDTAWTSGYNNPCSMTTPTLPLQHSEHASNVVHTAHIGSGDVFIVENFLDPILAATAKTSITQECEWFQLYDLTQGLPLPRSTSFQAEVDHQDGSLPVYRCDEPQPWDNQYTTSSWTPTIAAIRKEVELAAGHSFNWCRIQRYKDGGDGVTYHSDKCLDIQEGSYVASISLGDERYYYLKPKDGHDNDRGDMTGTSTTSPAQKLRIRHNTLLLLGPSTNRYYTHAIAEPPLPDRVDKKKRRGRISITFRLIATFYCPYYQSSLDRLSFYGQGAAKVTCKTELELANREVRRKRSIVTAGASVLSGAVASAVCHVLGTLFPNSMPSTGSSTTTAVVFASAVFAAATTQLVQLNISHSRNIRRTRRFEVVFSLMDLLPLTAKEAKRLIYEAEEEEIVQLVRDSRPVASSAMKRRYGYRTKGKLKFCLPACDADITEGQARGAAVSQHESGEIKGVMRDSRYDVTGGKGVLMAPSCASKTPVVSVCVIIDAVKDFLYASGAFAKAYGQMDTMKIRNMKLVLGRVYHYCHDHGIQVVLVTSKYHEQQFRTVPGLCVAESGREFAFECAECQGGCHRMYDDDIIITKTTNSILDCSDESRDLLLDTIRGKSILLCGVTTVACIRTAVEDLKEHCLSLHIAKDGVASRTSLADKEAKLLRQWGDDDAGDGGSFREGYDGGNDGYENVLVFDSWERCLQRRV